MNKRDLILKRNACASKLNHTSSRHRNCVRFFASNTIDHEMAKAEICYLLKKKNIEFVVEAEFKNGSRADIYVLDFGVAIEIMHSETKERLNAKNYPVPIYPISTSTVLNKDGGEYIMSMLSDMEVLSNE